ncbi:MAG TPA: hypothetical protein VG605_23515 [Puia sp.]|nr:hypothetical protein [Puia sp.]
MTRIYTLLTVAVVLGLSSCSSSRNAQNTDDIYYSDGNRNAVAASGSDQGEYYSTAPSDNYVRMKAQDYDRWSYFDDYDAYDAYYAPGYAYGMGMYPGVSYGLGFGYGMGLGYGLGFYDPYLAWNSYYMWNCWYNPYFYNPYYGGAVFIASGHSVPGAGYAATNLRPFSGTAYRSGLNRGTGATLSGARFYRPGMRGTSAYNNRLVNTGRSVNGTYYNRRPVNNTYYSRPVNNNNSYRPAFNNNNFGSRSYTPSSGGGFHGGGGGGGGFRAGGGGFRGH